MAGKDSSIVSVLADIVLAYVKRVNGLLHLAALEAQLAVKTLVVILMLIFVLGSVLTISWLSLLVLVFFYLLSLHFTLLTAALIVAGINFLVLGLIFFYIYKLKANLFFPATREQINHKPRNKAVIKNERITTEN